MKPPKIEPAAAVLVGLGAYLVFTDSGRSLIGSLFGFSDTAPAAPARQAQAPAQDWLGALIQTAGGIVQGLMPELEDRDSSIRQAARNYDRGKREVLGKLGLRSDPDDHKKRKEQLQFLISSGMKDMEVFAARVHSAASRADVKEWVIDTPDTGYTIDANTGLKQNRARISIYYKGQSSPFVLYAPENQILSPMRLAVIAEPIVRATGGFTQRGGRLANGAPFVYYVDPSDGIRYYAFSDTNPFAQKELMIGQIFGVIRSDEYQSAKLSKTRRKLSPGARKALDARVNENITQGRALQS